MISDSSTLILFARAGRLELLRELFGSLRVPREVARECMAAKPERDDARAIALARDTGWLKVDAAPKGIAGGLVRRHPNLGPGEVAAIALASASPERRLLADDGRARRAAALEGVVPMGCLGVLALAHRRGLLKGTEDVAAAVKDLLAAGLWVGPDVIEAFWAALGGRG